MNTSKFSGVPQTLFLVLWAQYLEGRRVDGVKCDSKINEIVRALDFDFSRFQVSLADQLCIAARKKIIGEQVQKFVSQNIGATVVNLGCGLDVKCEIFKSTNVYWWDLDLPDVISLRRRFFSESTRYQMIAQSVMDLRWAERIPKDKKVLFVAEGLLPYFAKREVKNLLGYLDQIFPVKSFLLHVVSPLTTLWPHYELRKAGLRLHWGVRNGKRLEPWFQSLELTGQWSIYPEYSSDYKLIKQLLHFCYSFGMDKVQGNFMRKTLHLLP